MRVDVIMPQMGESIQEGTLTRWIRKVGDPVKRDEPLFEISTDKVDAEIPAPAAGRLAEVKVEEGVTVPINTVVAVLETDASAAIGAAPAAAAAPAPAPAAAPAAAAPAAAPKPAPAATAPKPAPAPAAAGADATAEDLRRTRSSPVVRKIAAEHGVDIAALSGSGIGGRVTRKDILAAVESGATGRPAAGPTMHVPAFAPGERFERVPMTVMRRKIAEHMVLSRHTSAHVLTLFEVNYAAIDKVRREHGAAFLERHGVKLTYMPFIAKAVVESLAVYPVLNASIDGGDVLYKKDINLGIAVALDWGLIVPVVKGAADLTIAGIAKAIGSLADKARNKKLSPDDVAGGSFTITNPGQFGGLFGTPIINQPQVGILGVGGIEKRPIVIDDAIAIRPMGYLALSFDHRLVDGAVADQFMADVKKRLQEFTGPVL